MPEVRRLVTPPFRVSYPNVFEARAVNEGDQPKFSLSAIWTPADFTAKDKERWAILVRALKNACSEDHGVEWGDLDSSRRGLHNGKKKAGLEGYGEGTHYANLTSKMKPSVIDLDQNEISKEKGNEDKIYPGCWCRASVNVYTYTIKGKGVSLGLQNIQFIKHGDRIDSRTKASEDFDDDLDDEWLNADEELIDDTDGL